jgi:uncharacterized protein YecE (DUF72 family)
MFYVGCAIWDFDGWNERFYPPGLKKTERLHAYTRRLTAVEGNTTFYAIPTLPTTQRWAAEMPESFRFCPKFPKVISHTLQLKNAQAQTATFIGVMRLLGPRLGPLMLQLPPGFGPNRLPILQDYLASLPEDIRVAVEVRHPDWFESKTSAKLDEMLTATRASRVVFDVRPAHNSKSPLAVSAQERKPDVPLVPVALQNFVLVRYISSPVEEENDSYLSEWIPRLKTWLNEDREVYFFAHCPYEELSPTIARTVYHRLSAEIDLPPLPWDEIEKPASPADFKQLSLF